MSALQIKKIKTLVPVLIVIFQVFLLSFSIFFIYSSNVFAYDTCGGASASCYESYDTTCVTSSSYYSDRYLNCSGTQVFWEYRQDAEGIWYRTDSSAGSACSWTDHISRYLKSCNECCASGSGGVSSPSTFSVTAEPTTKIVYPGGMVTYNITVTPSGYAGTVNLDTMDAGANTCPTNAICTFSPTFVTITDTTAKTSTLTITTNSSIAIQHNNVVARGVDGSIVSAASIALDVKPNPTLYCDSTWRNMPGFYPASKLSAVRWDYYGSPVLRLFAPYSSGGYGGYIMGWCFFSTGGGICQDPYIATGYNVNTSAVDIYATQPIVFIKGADNNTYSLNVNISSEIFNLGVLSKPWDSPHSIIDDRGRLW